MCAGVCPGGLGMVIGVLFQLITELLTTTLRLSEEKAVRCIRHKTQTQPQCSILSLYMQLHMRPLLYTQIKGKQAVEMQKMYPTPDPGHMAGLPITVVQVHSDPVPTVLPCLTH